MLPIDIDRYTERIESLLASPVTQVEPITNGRNNIVFSFRTPNDRFVAKGYFYDAYDGRDRLESEYGMLSFLWSRGVRNISQPVALDRTNRLGIYKFIDGQTPRAAELTTEDVLSLVDLLARMWELRSDRAAEDLPRASAACFSLSDYVEMIDQRVQRLLAALDDIDATGRCVTKFLNEEFTPFLQQQCSILKNRADFNIELPLSRRTLSPSDHGFHNSIRTKSGCVFLDFEYSGWDDPAKMLTDACHHPAVPLSETLQEIFLDQMLLRLGSPSWLVERCRLISPIIGLNWCLIMLNEFIPVSRRRRQFAAPPDTFTDNRRTQLQLAREKFVQVLASATTLSPKMHHEF